MTTIYLDASIFGAWLDQQRGRRVDSPQLRADRAVLPGLLLGTDGEVAPSFVTSAEAAVEIERLASRRPDVAEALRELAGRVRQVPPAPAAQTASCAAVLRGLTGRSAPSKLVAVQSDARHLAAALASGCQAFLTVDYHTLWNHRAALQTQLGLRLLRPTEQLAAA